MKWPNLKRFTPYYTNSFKGFIFVDGSEFEYKDWRNRDKQLNVIMWYDYGKRFESNLMLRVTPVEEHKKSEVIRAIFEATNIDKLRNL